MDWILERLISGPETFVPRLVTLVALLTLAAGVELLLRGRRATRWRSYAFLLAAGALGAAVGAAIDAVTSSLSPEYFVHGKGLPGGESLRGAALRLGAHAGFAGGCAAAGILLVRNSPRAGVPALPLRRLARGCLLIAISAIAGAGLLLALGSALPLGLPFDPGIILPPPSRGRFALAWWTHIGAYAGALAATIAVAKSLRAAPESAEPAAARDPAP